MFSDRILRVEITERQEVGKVRIVPRTSVDVSLNKSVSQITWSIIWQRKRSSQESCRTPAQFGFVCHLFGSLEKYLFHGRTIEGRPNPVEACFVQLSSTEGNSILGAFIFLSGSLISKNLSEPK